MRNLDTPIQRDDESVDEYQERLSCFIDGMSDSELIRYVEERAQYRKESEDDYYPSDSYY